MPVRPPTFRHAWQPSERQVKAEYERWRNVRDPWRAWFRTPRWREMRAAVLRAQPICMRCRTAPSTVANHVIPHRGDPAKFWTGQLEGICASCHSGVIQSEEARER
jgi:5-methylcytosine-specific restriction endonuclease McrA